MLPPAPTVPDPFARLRRASRPSPGVSGSQPKHFCFGGFPFARPSPEGSSLAGLRRKWDRLAPHASSSIALPVASLAFIPKDVRRVRGGNVRKLSFLSERPSPATPIDCHARRFDERGIRLWIKRISGISFRRRSDWAFEPRIPPKVSENETIRSSCCQESDGGPSRAIRPYPQPPSPRRPTGSGRCRRR